MLQQGSILKVIAIVLSSYLLLLAAPLNAAIVLQLHVVEGEGTVYGTGSRATRGLTVAITDETGNPVEGASVSFRLPEEGPGGTFTGGLKTQVVTTQADGRAAVWGMQWNKTAGAFEIRITATKDQARAGLVSVQHLTDAVTVKGAGGAGTFQASHHSRTKWLLIGAAVAGGAVAGLAVGRTQSAKVGPVAPTVPTQIGIPSITIGHP